MSSKKIQPDIVDYIDTQLIECNRLHSVEYNSSENNGEPAIFTNEQRSGIQINPGDRISLNSAYVSQIGSGGEVIEFTGRQNGDTYTVEYTSSSDGELGDLDFDGSRGNFFKVEYSGLPYIQDNSNLQILEINSNITQTYKVQDNKIHFSTGFYKSTNGEGYIHLPRRFLNENSYNSYLSIVNSAVGSNSQYNEISAYQNRAYYNVNTADYFYEDSGMIVADAPQPHQILRADTHFKPFVYTEIGTGSPVNAPVLAKKNDNSRYQIFVRKNTYWYPPSDDQASNFKELFTTGNRNNYLVDIAMNDYIEYKKLQELSVDVGFDTPSNIASTLTEQLNRSTTTPIEILAYNSSDSSSQTNGAYPERIIYTNKYETPVFRAFRSATEQSFNQTGSRRLYAGTNSLFASSTSDTLIYNQASLDYFNSYHYIGIKRPELYKTGCLLNRASRVTNEPRNFQVNLSFTPPSSVSDGIQINVKWQEVNASTGRTYLDEFKDFFDSQDLYPELFDYSTSGLEGVISSTLNSSNSRLLHIQPFDSGNYSQLGGDSMVFPGDTAVHTSYPRPDHKCSSPLFISYDPLKKNNIDIVKDGNNINELWGGFAYRTQRNGVDFITFKITPNLSTLLNPDLLNASGIIEINRPIGYDQHFSGYGNSMIALYNGINMIDFSDFQQRDVGIAVASASESIEVSQKASQNLFEDKAGRTYYTGFDKFKFSYLGALSPLINFDDITDRFTIGGLHSPEFIGNFRDAGISYITAENPIPKSDTPGQEVYYINKRLKNNNYCPDMIPYKQTSIQPVQGTSGRYSEGTTILGFNENLERGIIYDSFSGIKINTFGSDRKNWDNNSLFGIMGFDYNVLHPTTPTNIQTKYNYDTVNHTTDGLMTSALVEIKETLAQSQNQVNAPYFNYTLPNGATIMTAFTFLTLPVAYNNINQDRYKSTFNVPLTTQNTQSAVIRASNLPKKTTRPYYLIRSNIIAQDNFIGGEGQRLPVVGVVNKINGYADFYSTEGSGVEFTATKPFVINNITTSIHLPNGELARISDASSVIYKIQKQMEMTTNLEQILLQV
jgi:hypothetical protein